MDVRKIIFIRETTTREADRLLDRPITRAAGLVAFANPLAGMGYTKSL
ncbi:MAG: amino acid synthesis family protein [Alphaproteobacteria bacterium]|nr:amino acid synthesis family protein [Alphaproteobacteria bacterium]